MKRLAVTFISGVVLGILIGAPAIYWLFSEYEMNESKAYYKGAMSVVNKLEKEYGSIPYSDKNFEKVVVSVKTNEIVSVYENGIKTIKVTGF